MGAKAVFDALYSLLFLMIHALCGSREKGGLRQGRHPGIVLNRLSKPLNGPQQLIHLLRRGGPAGAVADHMATVQIVPVGKAEFADEKGGLLARQHGKLLIGVS